MAGKLDKSFNPDPPNLKKHPKQNRRRAVLLVKASQNYGLPLGRGAVSGQHQRQCLAAFGLVHQQRPLAAHRVDKVAQLCHMPRRVNRARLTVGAHLRRGFLLINMVSGVSRHLPFNDAVFFQNDNINTLDEDAELRLAIMSSIAQDELRKLSSRVKFGHQQAIKNNVVLGNSRIFGYRKENRRLVIDEEQAPMVRELFELYATDQYSMKQIEALFWEKGYRNLNGKKIAHTTMSNMISNPKYKGYYVGNKVKVVDMFTKKQKFLPPEEWVMFKDETGEIVPGIVSEEIWDAANAVLKKRSEDVKARQGVCNHANLLTGKLWCTECGQPYYRRESEDKRGRKNSKWLCSGKIKNGADSCKSFAIYESEIKPLLFEVFRDTAADADAMVEEYIRMYNELTQHGSLRKKIEQQNNIIDQANRKKNKLLQLAADDSITNADFKKMTADCNREIEEAEKEIAELEQTAAEGDAFKQKIDEIRRVLTNAQRDAAQGIITKEFIDKYISKIFVTPKDDTTMLLQVKIFTGETTEKYLRKLESRTGHITRDLTEQAEKPDAARVSSPDDSMGHTSKKMIEAYERSMK